MPVYVSAGAATNLNTQTIGDQLRQSVTRLADGTLVAVWETTNTTQDGSGSAIVMRRLDATGSPIGGEVVVNAQAASNQIKAQVTALAGGGYVVTWETADAAQDGNGTAIKAQIFDASGVAVGGEFRVNSMASLNQQQPTITGLADGSFVVAWQTTDTAQDGSGWALKGQRFGATGTLLGGEFRINGSAAGSQNNADIVSLANGGFVVTWQIGNNASSTANARVYDASGAAVGNDISVANFGGEIDTAVMALADGGFAVVYSRGGGIFFQRFDALRVKAGGEVYVGDGLLPEIAALTEGGFVIGWRANGNQMLARTFGATGSATSSAFVLGTDSNTGVEGSIVALAGGGFASFASGGISGTGSGQDIRLQIFQPQANAAPELGAATRAIAIAENGTVVATITATDDGGPSPVTYSIAGGADAARFTINATTGALRFAVAPNREAPSDAGGDNVYDVIVSASDGALSDTQAIAVTVTNVNEAPVIASNGGGASAAITLAENGTAVTTVIATDVDSVALSYAITGGIDAARFAIDAATGVLSFVAAPDFESPADSGGDNVYTIIVRASDGSLVDTQTLNITVTNANETPTIISPASYAIGENATLVGVVTAADPDGTAATYAITGGADAALFVIDGITGALRFVSAPDFETPGDANADGVYDVIVGASDGALSDGKALAVTVANINEGVGITSAPAITAAENDLAVGTVSATDVDGDAIVYAIAGGADAALFVIDQTTGALSFARAADFEAPGDAGGDNVYDVIVSASDGHFIDTQAISVAIANVDEGVTITSDGGGASAAVSLFENGLAVATIAALDADGDPVSYGIAGGSDAALFVIDQATGELRFAHAPDFEAPGDAGADNVYDVVVQAGAGAFSDTQALAITVGNVDEGVTITSSGGGDVAALSIVENVTAVASVLAVDADHGAVSYTIAGGADAAFFAIDAQTGALRLIAAPNHEAPSDAGGNNVYDVLVAASDGVFTDTQALAVTVTDAREGNTITGTNSANTISITAGPAGRPFATELEDTIQGLGGNDTISAAGGEDIVDGGTGNDLITGGAGADSLTGGAGADRFTFSATSDSAIGAADIITDFSRSQADRINLNPIDARTNATGNQNFTFIGGADFSGVAGQLRFEQIDGNTFVTGDVNGDKAADFSIQLNGVVPLTSADFIL